MDKQQQQQQQEDNNHRDDDNEALGAGGEEEKRDVNNYDDYDDVESNMSTTNFRQKRKAGIFRPKLGMTMTTTATTTRSVKSCRCGGGGSPSAAAVRFDIQNRNRVVNEQQSDTYESSNYRDTLNDIRQTFPQPVSDRCHDAYFGFTIMRALDQVDSLKTKAPILGKSNKNDYNLARQSELSDDGETVEEVNAELVKKLEGIPIWGHPLTQINVVCPTTIPSIVGSVLASTYNPNLVSDDYSCGLAQAEVAVTAMMSRLVGYDPMDATGIFTFGGTGTVLYGVKIGIEKSFPGSMRNGIRGVGDDNKNIKERPPVPVLIASDAAHYCRLTVAGWLGIGQNNVLCIETNLRNEVKTAIFETRAREAIQQGKRIVCIVATMGTTDALGIDELQEIVRIRDKLVEDYKLDYKPHIHADAVIGWAWSVFNDYDFDENRLGFRQRTVHALRGVSRRISTLNLADSIGIDFHKTGFCPYNSSMILVKKKKDMATLSRDKEDMPYLFSSGQYHPGKYTLEASRGGGGVLAAYANLKMFGKNGSRSLIGHLVEMAELLREYLEGFTSATVLNNGNYGSCTLFRLYPTGVDTWTIADLERTDANYRESLLQHNEYNRRIYEYMHTRSMSGLGAHISMTSHYRTSDYGEPILALKSYILSPFIDEAHIETFVEDLKEARKFVASQQQ